MISILRYNIPLFKFRITYSTSPDIESKFVYMFSSLIFLHLTLSSSHNSSALCAITMWYTVFFFYCRTKPINAEKHITRYSAAMRAPAQPKFHFSRQALHIRLAPEQLFHYAPFILCRLCCQLKCSSPVFKHIILILFYFLLLFHLADCWQWRRWRRRRHLLKYAALYLLFYFFIHFFFLLLIRFICAPTCRAHSITLALRVTARLTSQYQSFDRCTFDPFARGVFNSSHIAWAQNKPIYLIPAKSPLISVVCNVLQRRGCHYSASILHWWGSSPLLSQHHTCPIYNVDTITCQPTFQWLSSSSAPSCFLLCTILLIAPNFAILVPRSIS